jgi:NitT/TauT family transport system permease protein
MTELFKMGGSVGKKTDTTVFFIGLMLLLSFWYMVTYTGVISNRILPNPVDVVKSYSTMLFEYNLLENAWYSIKLNFLGYFYALVISIPIGFIIGMFPIGKSLFNKIFDAFRFIPLPATTGIFIAIFGLAFNMKANFLAFGIIIYILPVVIQRINELQNPSNDKDFVFLQTIKTLGASNWQKFRYVYFPYVMGKISDDIRVLTAISWTYISIVEILNKDGGIGSLISTLSRQSRTAEVYALIFLIIIIGILQDLLFRWIDKKLFPYKHDKKPFSLKNIIQSSTVK